MPRVYPPIDGRTSQKELPPSIVESTAGFSAGVVSTLVVHPFDVIKTRLQVDQSSRIQVGSSIRIARNLARDEGILSGLYRGLTPNLIGNSVSWALYFLWYAQIKSVIQSYRGASNRLKPQDFFIASGASGIVTAIFTNPIWVIKTRMLSTARSTPGAYTSIAQGFSHILRTEGPRGFYRGLTPSLFGVSHGAIQFMAYEQLKAARMNQLVKHRARSDSLLSGRSSSKPELSNWDYLVLSAISKIFAGSITYPYQVVRARLQVYDADRRYNGALDVVRQVWKGEGIAGFYKGLGPNIVRVLPSTCVTFLVYENTKIYLPKLYGDSDTDI